MKSCGKRRESLSDPSDYSVNGSVPRNIPRFAKGVIETCCQSPVIFGPFGSFLQLTKVSLQPSRVAASAKDVREVSKKVLASLGK